MFWARIKRFFQQRRIRRAQRQNSCCLLLKTVVHGTHYYEAHRLLTDKQLSVGERLLLRHETDCEYDARAIEIYTIQQHKLGYIPRRKNAVLANLLDQAEPLYAILSDIQPRDWDPLTVSIYWGSLDNNSRQ